jgi:hypothetical protein
MPQGSPLVRALQKMLIFFFVQIFWLSELCLISQRQLTRQCQPPEGKLALKPSQDLTSWPLHLMRFDVHSEPRRVYTQFGPSGVYFKQSWKSTCHHKQYQQQLKKSSQPAQACETGIFRTLPKNVTDSSGWPRLTLTPKPTPKRTRQTCDDLHWTPCGHFVVFVAQRTAKPIEAPSPSPCRVLMGGGLPL